MSLPDKPDTANRRLAAGVVSASVLVAGGFALFAQSARFWPRWWEVASMPTAEQWSAFFGASALIALAFAWYQIRQVDQSNRLVVEANAAQRAVSMEATRPRVVMTVHVNHLLGVSAGLSAVSSPVYARVSNIGASPALAVRMKIDYPFEVSTRRFTKNSGPTIDDVVRKQLAETNAVFDGTFEIPIILPGRYYQWRIGRDPEIFEETQGERMRYNFELDYKSPLGHPYSETSTIDFNLERDGGS